MNISFRMFRYLKHHLRTKIKFDPQQINMERINYIYDNKWQDIHLDSKEATVEKVPEANNPEVKITVCKDASHATDLLNIRSVKDIMIFLQYNRVKNYSKHENPVERSTYGSKFMAMKLAVEQLLEICYKLRMMGLRVEKCSNISRYNKFVLMNMQLTSIFFK